MSFSLSFRLFLVCCLAAFASLSQADNLKPFRSDGCSLFPDGTLEQRELWLGCCRAHDYAYWKGGSYQQRLEADRMLEACVANMGEPEIATLMLVGVRLGGSPFLPTEFRWGYGWSYPRFYKPLTASELNKVKNLEIQSIVPLMLPY